MFKYPWLSILLIPLLIILVFYVLQPNPEFPAQVPGSKQSQELADTETPLRRAYFTDATREEVMAHYMNEMRKQKLFGIPFPTYRLNYPPEEATVLIRDQARSTFLEEIVHPFRESLYVNGFEPKLAKDAVNIEGVLYRQKITVRLYPSSPGVRLASVLATVIVLYFVFVQLIDIFKTLKQLIFKQ